MLYKLTGFVFYLYRYVHKHIRQFIRFRCKFTNYS
nr:MAG TPA: hypothetical protein [Caudoviricetes sp.]DAY89531.1 MAG TPA: hypothetical protein [Caudoviricetes sp.]